MESHESHDISYWNKWKTHGVCWRFQPGPSETPLSASTGTVLCVCDLAVVSLEKWTVVWLLSFSRGFTMAINIPMHRITKLCYDTLELHEFDLACFIGILEHYLFLHAILVTNQKWQSNSKCLILTLLLLILPNGIFEQPKIRWKFTSTPVLWPRPSSAHVVMNTDKFIRIYRDDLSLPWSH